MFSRSEVIVQTNKHIDKQTPLKTPTALRYATSVNKRAFCKTNVMKSVSNIS